MTAAALGPTAAVCLDISELLRRLRSAGRSGVRSPGSCTHPTGLPLTLAVTHTPRSRLLGLSQRRGKEVQSPLQCYAALIAISEESGTQRLRSAFRTSVSHIEHLHMSERQENLSKGVRMAYSAAAVSILSQYEVAAAGRRCSYHGFRLRRADVHARRVGRYTWVELSRCSAPVTSPFLNWLPPEKCGARSQSIARRSHPNGAPTRADWPPQIC